MLRSLLIAIVTASFCITANAIPLRVHCPFPHSENIYKNMNVFIASTTLNEPGFIAKTNSAGIVHFPKNFVTTPFDFL